MVSQMRILISSNDYPGYGGGATNTYAIYYYLTNRYPQYNIGCIFFHNDFTANFDPMNIGNVLSLSYDMNGNKNKSRLKMIEKRLFSNNKPDIIFCKNNYTPVICRKLWPTTNIIYLACGVDNVFNSMEMNARTLIDNNIQLNNLPMCELEAIIRCDIVVFNSRILRDVFSVIYPRYLSKYYSHTVDTSKLTVDMLSSRNSGLDCTYENKKYDIIVTSSILTRKEKNHEFTVDVLCDERMNKYSILIIGEQAEMFNAIINKNNNTTIINSLVEHNKLYEYLSLSKVILQPSLIDSNPNTIREAINMNCIPISSTSVGMIELFPEIIKCDKFDKELWISKIKYILDNKIQIEKHEYKYETCKLLDDIVNII